MFPYYIITGLVFQWGYSQIEFKTRIEAGYLQFNGHFIGVDPDVDWKGMNNDDQNGIETSVLFGAQFKKRRRAAIGIGYLNFEGINGVSVFGDFQFLLLKTKLSPFINFKAGYNHIWNSMKTERRVKS